MWVMTPYGYTSAVAHRKKKDSLLVRARDQKSLEYFCDLAGIKRAKIHTDFPSDYPFRVIAKRWEYTQYLVASAEQVDYDNFKTRAGKVRGKDGFTSFLMSVWSSSHSLTPKSVAKKNDAKRDAEWAKHRPAGTSRWSKDGAWGSYWGGHDTPLYDHLLPDDDGGDDDATEHAGFLSVSEIMEMSDYDREMELMWLDNRANEGDVDAADLRDEIDALLDDEPLVKSVHAMTDAEFAQYEEN